MEKSLKILSIIAVVLGGASLLGAASQPTLEDAVYAILGGGMFLAQGILTLFFISRVNYVTNKLTNKLLDKIEDEIVKAK